MAPRPRPRHRAQVGARRWKHGFQFSPFKATFCQSEGMHANPQWVGCGRKGWEADARSAEHAHCQRGTYRKHQRGDAVADSFNGDLVEVTSGDVGTGKG